MLGLGDYILLGLLALAVIAALRQMHGAKKSGKGCCGSCFGCTHQCAQKHSDKQ